MCTIFKKLGPPFLRGMPPGGVPYFFCEIISPFYQNPCGDGCEVEVVAITQFESVAYLIGRDLSR